MCGITGCYYFDNKHVIDYNSILEMNDTLYHRGPDDDGYFIEGNIGFGQRRLSIIDLESGKQPIYNEDKSIIAICNGEIYNYKKLTNYLRKKGHHFTTQTDVEVIVHLYEEMGTEFPNILEGMFAIALWDKNTQKLVLCRDHTGIKPLFYYLDNDAIFFASELKAIKINKNIDLEINLEAVSDYFSFSYIPGPKTIYKNCKKLDPGSIMIFDKNGLVENKKYWNVYDFNKHEIKSKNEYVNDVFDLINDSVKSHLVSDVPFGCFLSGGIDSSIVAAFMAKNLGSQLKTFSIGFDIGEYNELNRARIVANALNSEHHEELLKPNIENIIMKLSHQYDEPFADSSAIATYLVSEMASNHVKMCLSGDGGDELFGGYRRYQVAINNQWYDDIPNIVKKLCKRTSDTFPNGFPGKARLKSISQNKYNRYIEDLTVFNSETEKYLFNKSLNTSLSNYKSNLYFNNNQGENIDFINELCLMDFVTYLVDSNLQKVDRASMLNSLEVRVPFLNRALIEYAYSIPGSVKINNGNLKIILKEIAAMILPKEIIKFPKKGFSIPIKYWIRNELNIFLKDIILDRNSLMYDYIEYDYVNNLFLMHNTKNCDYSRHLWSIINFELWIRNYYKNK